VTAVFTVTNTGSRDGADVPQLYLTAAPNGKRLRLLGFERIALRPGESRKVTMTADPRMRACFDDSRPQWRPAEGGYQVALARSAATPVESAEVRLTARLFGC